MLMPGLSILGDFENECGIVESYLFRAKRIRKTTDNLSIIDIFSYVRLSRSCGSCHEYYVCLLNNIVVWLLKQDQR